MTDHTETDLRRTIKDLIEAGEKMSNRLAHALNQLHLVDYGYDPEPGRCAMDRWDEVVRLANKLK